MSAKHNSTRLIPIQSKTIDAEPGMEQRETILVIGDYASETGKR
jgi:hypothetical protein